MIYHQVLRLVENETRRANESSSPILAIARNCEGESGDRSDMPMGSPAVSSLPTTADFTIDTARGDLQVLILSSSFSSPILTFSS